MFMAHRVAFAELRKFIVQFSVEIPKRPQNKREHQSNRNEFKSRNSNKFKKTLGVTKNEWINGPVFYILNK